MCSSKVEAVLMAGSVSFLSLAEQRFEHLKLLSSPRSNQFVETATTTVVHMYMYMYMYISVFVNF